jgi:hypothetical protein
MVTSAQEKRRRDGKSVMRRIAPKKAQPVRKVNLIAFSNPYCMPFVYNRPPIRQASRRRNKAAIQMELRGNFNAKLFRTAR